LIEAGPWFGYLLHRVWVWHYTKGNFFIGHKKTCGFLVTIKKSQLSIGHWVEILLLIDHPSVKVREQKSLLPLIIVFVPNDPISHRI
jgi:hypothetical protein